MRSLLAASLLLMLSCSGEPISVVTDAVDAVASLEAPRSIEVTSQVVPSMRATMRPASRWVTPVPYDGIIPDRVLEEAIVADGLSDSLMRKGLRDGWLGWAVVEIGAADIKVGGETVVALSSGRVDAAEKRGVLISPLFNDLKEMADSHKAFAEQTGVVRFEGRLLLVVDPSSRFKTLREVMYTAGQSQYAEFAFLVGANAPPAVPPSAQGDRLVHLSIGPDGGWSLNSLDGKSAQVAGASDLGARLDAVLGDRAALGCATLAVADGITFGHMAVAMEAFGAFGVSPVYTSASVPAGSPPPPPPAVAAPPIRLGDELPVHESSLPAIGSPSSPSTQGECFRGAPHIRVLAAPPHEGLQQLLEDAEKLGSGPLGSRGKGR